LEITACPNCGSRRIFQGRLKDGVITGYTSRDVCRDCGYRGSPLIFDNLENYKNFLKGLKAEKEGKTTELEEKDVELSEKEKEVVDFLKESENKGVAEIKFESKALKNFIVLFMVLIFSLVIALFFVPFDFFLPTVLIVIVLFIIVYLKYRIIKN
jgi:Flp pilus assembly protein TadB